MGDDMRVYNEGNLPTPLVEFAQKIEGMAAPFVPGWVFDDLVATDCEFCKETAQRNCHWPAGKGRVFQLALCESCYLSVITERRKR